MDLQSVLLILTLFTVFILLVIVLLNRKNTNGGGVAGEKLEQLRADADKHHQELRRDLTENIHQTVKTLGEIVVSNQKATGVSSLQTVRRKHPNFKQRNLMKLIRILWRNRKR